ncbi:MAG TPA: divalent-cation tolerance protein CutA [Candidatus Nitrosopolaris sp.]|nr:divalent-cation tolerance protein CutA [Candidatus Nitrosopolaris sp.]
MSKKKTSGVIIVSTFPTEESVKKIASDLILNEKVCACVNLMRVQSVYNWQSELQDQVEILALFKTTNWHSERVKEEIKKRHPYQVPEIAELKMDSVSVSYLRWIEQSTGLIKNTV